MVLSFIPQAVNAILAFVNSLGYLGIFLGMLIESSIIPIPGELILIPAGALVAQGHMNFLLVLIAGISGSIVGSWICYFIALFIGRRPFEHFVEKHGSLFFITKEHLQLTEGYFKSYGKITIFTSRLIPVVRHLISLPAGFSRMNLAEFTAYTFFGAGIYGLFLVVVGYFFGSSVPSFFKYVTAAIFVLCFAIIVLYYLRISRRKKQKINFKDKSAAP